MAARLLRFVPPPATFTYTHIQSSPATTWVVTHSLGKFPSVTVVDNTGEVIVTDVLYIDQNEINVLFDSNETGKVYLN